MTIYTNAIEQLDHQAGLWVSARPLSDARVALVRLAEAIASDAAIVAGETAEVRDVELACRVLVLYALGEWLTDGAIEHARDALAAMLAAAGITHAVERVSLSDARELRLSLIWPWSRDVVRPGERTASVRDILFAV